MCAYLSQDDKDVEGKCTRDGEVDEQGSLLQSQGRLRCNGQYFAVLCSSRLSSKIWSFKPTCSCRMSRSVPQGALTEEILPMGWVLFNNKRTWTFQLRTRSKGETNAQVTDERDGKHGKTRQNAEVHPNAGPERCSRRLTQQLPQD